MRSIRQPRKKQTSLQLPSTSLHLMQVSKFIEEYLHAQQKYLINLSAHSVQTHLPIRADEPDRSFDIDLNVPYIESQHYDSNATFTDQHIKTHPILDDENFTDREAFNSMCSDALQSKGKKEQYFEEEEIVLQDFKFIKNDKKSKDSPQLQQSQAYFSKPHSSATLETEKPSRTAEEQEEVELQHLQETAYFLQEREKVDRKLMYSSENYQGNNENISMINKQPQAKQTKPVTSKKAIFLNKIEKEKSRKEIAQAISKERHHIKKFLK